MSALHIESFVIDAPSSFKVAAKRYTHPESKNLEGITLLCTHALGSHKEQWEPALSSSFALQQAKQPTHRIREAWSLDWQNHGASAVLNHQLLQGQPEGVSVFKWAEAIAAFVKSPTMEGHRIVALGHSAGSTAIMLSAKFVPLNKLSDLYQSIVILESSIITQKAYKECYGDRIQQSMNNIRRRKDRWESKKAARDYFSKQWPYKNWDKRAIDLFCEHGLRPFTQEELSKSGYTSAGVTFKCDLGHEVAAYLDQEPHHEAAAQIARVCNVVPIHVMWGSRPEFVPERARASLSDESEGRIAASVAQIKGAGHTVIQEQPGKVALHICEILDGISLRRLPHQSLTSRL